jgi:hypothetical protein
MNDTQPGKSKFLFLALLIVLAGLIPIGSYWHWIGRGPGLEPQQAWDLLHRPGANSILVDVRTPKDFAAGHLEGAVNWPYHEIMTFTPAQSIFLQSSFI